MGVHFDTEAQAIAHLKAHGWAHRGANEWRKAGTDEDGPFSLRAVIHRCTPRHETVLVRVGDAE